MWDWRSESHLLTHAGTREFILDYDQNKIEDNLGRYYRDIRMLCFDTGSIYWVNNYRGRVQGNSLWIVVKIWGDEFLDKESKRKSWPSSSFLSFFQGRRLWREWDDPYGRVYWHQQDGKLLPQDQRPISIRHAVDCMQLNKQLPDICSSNSMFYQDNKKAFVYKQSTTFHWYYNFFYI